uniref:Acyl-CoA oxidase C-terminal domain-containing protein n=1 Tax=Glossina austeni TaxID=7395 RepID=A0A1A9VIP7_GLOAU
MIKDVSFDAVDNQGCTPIFYAIEHNHEEIVKKLWERPPFYNLYALRSPLIFCFYVLERLGLRSVMVTVQAVWLNRSVIKLTEQDVNRLELHLRECLKRLRPNVVTQVDGFDLHDRILDSALVAKIVSPLFGRQMQRTLPTASVYSDNANNIIDLIFDNNNTLQNISTSKLSNNTHTPNESRSINREILACSVKLSLFWSNCPETCFIKAEAQFASKGITQDPIADFTRDPPATNKYEGGAEVSVFPLFKLPNNKKSSDITLTAEKVSTINTYGKKLLNINLNLRRDFPFAFLIADISRLIIRAVFVTKYSLLVDVKRTRLLDSLTNIE